MDGAKRPGALEHFSESCINGTSSLPKLRGIRHRLKMLLECVEAKIGNELAKQALEEYTLNCGMSGGDGNMEISDGNCETAAEGNFSKRAHVRADVEPSELLTEACCPLCLSTAGSSPSSCPICEQSHLCQYCCVTCQACQRRCCAECAVKCTGCGSPFCHDCLYQGNINCPQCHRSKTDRDLGNRKKKLGARAKERVSEIFPERMDRHGLPSSSRMFSKEDEVVHWEKKFKELLAYKKEHGDCRVTEGPLMP